MTKIEKIENVMADDEITKVVMSINDGKEVVEGEVYLAFVDTSTNKRYMVYTTEQAKNENDRIPFTLSTLVLEENGYVLEETTKEDHQNVELPILNMIGLNGDKEPEEVEKMIHDKFPNIITLPVQPLINNVENMTVSETRPPKKANMPITIANVIKKYYLHQLNKELKKIYNTTQMSEEVKTASIEKLDDIQGKLEDVKEVYEQNAEKKGGTTPSIEKSLNQIETANIDIEAAKNRIQNLPDEYVEEETEKETPIDYPLQDTLPLERAIIRETLKSIEKDQKAAESEPLSIEKTAEEPTSKKITVEEESVEPKQEKQTPVVKEQPEVVQVDISDDQVQQRIQELIDESVGEFANSFEILVNRLQTGISNIYGEQLKNDAIIIDGLKQQLRQLDEDNKREKNEMLSQIAVLGKKADEVNQQAVNSKKTISDLQQQLTTSQQNEQQLKQDNENLKGEVTSQKQLLDQQNALIDGLRKESNSRDEQQQSEIARLQAENNSLKIYQDGYNKIAGMFANSSMPNPMPVVDPQQQLINEAVEYALSEQEQSTKH